MSEEPYTPNLVTIKDIYVKWSFQVFGATASDASEEFQRFLSKFYEAAREDERYDRENKYDN